MRIRICGVISFSVLLVICAFGQQPEAKKLEDSIRIIGVSTLAPVVDGVEVEFAIQVQYTLEAADEAMVAVGFNVDHPGRFRMMGKKKISRGTNVITLKAKVSPKDWKEEGDFMVYVNLAPYPVRQGRYTPYANAEKVIDFN